MLINPFSGYLDYFSTGYHEDEISREKLVEADFPVDLTILENKGTGLTPIRYSGQDFFNVRELIGYARMYSLPNEGFISRKPIRAAEILDTETREDEETGDLIIKTVHVACAFMPPEDRRRGAGHVVFICPFCGCVHYHGCGGEEFGDGNGDRVPHCQCDDPDYYRLNSQKYGLLLDKNWHFDLVETEDFRRAGDFPKYFAKDLVNRSKG